MILSFVLCPFFRANFNFGGQEFAGKQDKRQCGNTACAVAGRCEMNLLEAKIYNDGSNWIAIPHTERPYRQRRRRKQPEKSEELQQFEKAFTESKGKRKSRKAKLLQEFTPMFKDEDEAAQFVEEHFERLSRNRWERYKRMIRRGYTNRWNFFCTYTYDSRKHTEETFRTSLMNTLYHLSSRRDWLYMGAWERGELENGYTSTRLLTYRKVRCRTNWKSMKIIAPSGTGGRRAYRTVSLTSGSGGASSRL